MTSAEPIAGLRVLHLDDALVAVSKPCGMLVHRAEHDPSAPVLLQSLRDQIGRWLFPVQRLDRATSGIVTFALSRPAAAALQQSLQADDARKCYLALVRGSVPEAWRDERPLTDDGGVARAAVTNFRRLRQFDRCALVEAELETGRWHQIRRHLAHAAHHVLGDTTHGKGRDNRFFRAQRGLHRLFLHAHRLEIRHPATGARLQLADPLPPELAAVLQRLPPQPCFSR
jgi:tRNA pseudouridine65 synthase